MPFLWKYIYIISFYSTGYKYWLESAAKTAYRTLPELHCYCDIVHCHTLCSGEWYLVEWYACCLLRPLAGCLVSSSSHKWSSAQLFVYILKLGWMESKLHHSLSIREQHNFKRKKAYPPSSAFDELFGKQTSTKASPVPEFIVLGAQYAVLLRTFCNIKV